MKIEIFIRQGINDSNITHNWVASKFNEMLVINANEFKKFIVIDIVENNHFIHFALVSFCC